MIHRLQGGDYHLFSSSGAGGGESSNFALRLKSEDFKVKWGYVRIITGTIFGGILGFYVMHRVELSYKEKMKERLRQYEIELKKREKLEELQDSL
ncbi:hypothetical protein V6N11_011874 [Hibiscus sabdariffa]|uniref:Uncharacterized protein n=1 Tax=Hibiscus sabdariffa TaxID=183260 RepID=A0ABR2S9I8_9ROSI